MMTATMKLKDAYSLEGKFWVQEITVPRPLKDLLIQENKTPGLHWNLAGAWVEERGGRPGAAGADPVPGILQARTLEWVAISFSNA